MNAPILIYHTQGQNLKNEIYDFNRVKASTVPVSATMSPIMLV